MSFREGVVCRLLKNAPRFKQANSLVSLRFVSQKIAPQRINVFEQGIHSIRFRVAENLSLLSKRHVDFVLSASTAI
jgi:hypothetical protein